MSNSKQTIKEINRKAVGWYCLSGKGKENCISFATYNKPSFIKRFFMRTLLDFYWIEDINFTMSTNEKTSLELSAMTGSMNKRTPGCIYSCGGVCTGECNREMISLTNQSEKDLYSEIEHLIITWRNDGTKTAGVLTCEIVYVLKERGCLHSGT